MRNTFVKLFLALAMCFMIGSALVACGSEFTLSVIDGYFAVNGEKTDIKAPAEGANAADCEHDIVISTVKEHTLVEEGVYLETCTLCNDYAKVVVETKHDFEENVEQAATCYVDAFKGQVCKICGARGEGETEEGSAAHDWSKGRAIDAIAGAPACVNEGIMMRNCETCGLVDEPKLVAAVGHLADHWDVVDYPSVDEKGEAEGKCIYCETIVSYDLPAIYVEGEFNADFYSLEYVDGVAPTCTEKSQANYTYKAKEAQNADKVWNTNIKFSVKEDAPATGHFLAGQKATKWANKDNKYPYFADVNGNGKVESKETLGITLFAGKTLMCDTETTGYYTCTVCNEIESVDVVVDHNGPRTVKEVAKCYAPGKDIVACNLCKKDKEVTTYAEHNIVYDLVAFDAEGVEIEVVDKDTEIAKWVLTSYCDVKVPVEVEDDDDDTPAATTFIECWEQTGVDASLVGAKVTKEFTGADLDLIKLQDTVDSTCFAQGYNLYQYTKVDVEDPEKKEYISVKVPLELAAHTLNGKATDKYETITVDIPGITPFAAGDFKTCGNWYPAYFECSVCAKEIKAGNTAVTTAIAKIDALKAHVFKVTPVEGGAATCTADGKQEVICTYAECGEDGSNWASYAPKDPRVIPALGHTYTYTANISGTKLELTAVCSVCDAEGVNAQLAHEVKFVDDKAIELNKPEFLAGVTPEKVAELSCVSREINKYTVVLALNVEYVVETPDDPATEDVNEEVMKAVASVTRATLKDPDSKVKEYNEKYTFTVSFNVEGDIAPQGHKFPNSTDADYEDKLIKIEIIRDWDKDGVNDQVFEYTYKHCPVCDLNELVDVELVESLTDKTIADAVEDEE